MTGLWVAIIGAGRDGRVDAVDGLARRLSAGGRAVGGFLQRTVYAAGEEIVGYDVVRVPGGDAIPLARESSDPELCRWSFDPQTFDTARGWTLDRPLDVAFVEAGRLEAAERGHWRTVLESLRTQPLTVVCIRRGVLASVALRLPDPLDALELPASEAEVAAFQERVVAHERTVASSRN